jgi:hypothetical protein
VLLISVYPINTDYPVNSAQQFTNIVEVIDIAHKQPDTTLKDACVGSAYFE